MKAFIVVLSVISVVFGKPSGQFLLAPAGTVVLGAPLQQQYHSQDGLGQYAYGYSDILSSKQETKSLDGVTRGAYSYVDAEGKLQSVSYTADALNGFRVAATNLPVAPKAVPVRSEAVLQPILPQPVSDTVEVAAAKAAHLKAVENVRAGVSIAAVKVFSPVELPKPVEDTPEVAKAKLEHYAAKKAAELRNAQAEAAATLITAQALPVPVARIAPSPALYQPNLKAASLSNGFAYSYAINAPYVWDSRYLVQSPRFYW